MMYTAFVVSSIVDDNPIGDKIDTHAVPWLEQRLNSRLQLATYGPEVKGIAVVFLGTDPAVDAIHREEFRFESSSREVYLQLRLPYAALERATEAEVLLLLVQRYVQGLQEAAALVPEFDWARLGEAAEEALMQEG